MKDTQGSQLRPFPATVSPSHPLHSAQVPHTRIELGVELSVQARRLGYRFSLECGTSADLGALVIPPSKAEGERNRRDELWKHTCLELFFGPEGAASYFELNLSPSGDWNLYAFDSYRTGMRPAALGEAPGLKVKPTTQGFVWSGELDLAPLVGKGALVLGATAVLEYSDGVREYWAIDHCGEKPDFHLRESFRIRIQG